MKAENVMVKDALVRAGFGSMPLETRGELFATLAQILKENPGKHGDLVDELREVLSAAVDRENEMDLVVAKSHHTCISGCPECDHKPDFGREFVTEDGQSLVVCMNHDQGAVTQAGDSLVSAIKRWNSADAHSPGQVRTQYPL